MAHDVRYAIRTLIKTPAFTIVVVVTLALGIGANTAIFSLTDQVLLRLLPVKSPERLVVLDGPGAFQGRTFNNGTFSYPMYRDFRDRTTVFDGVLARFPAPLTLMTNGQAERVSSELVSGNYFDVLGVRAHIGRTFTPDDDKTPGGHPVVMLSHNYWARRFGADPGVLNRTITLNGLPMTIVGVAPPGFYGITVGDNPDVMVPVMMKAQMTPTWDDLQNRRSRWLTVMARLKAGVSRAQAEAAMNVVYRQINEQEIKEIKAPSQSFRERFLSKHLFLRPGQKGRSDLRQQFSTPIFVLMGMVGLVLLIACANVANLLLARGAARQKEVAIRLALGAGRGAIVRQRLVESLMLSGAGAMLGLAFAWWTGTLLLKTLPFDEAARTLSATPDARVAAFALVAACPTAVLFGLAPALQSTRPVLTSTLKDESGSVVGGTGHARFRKGLVVAQAGLSVLLLAGAALFTRSLYNLKTLKIKTVATVMDESLFMERMVAALSVAFGAPATLLAAIGLYGVMSYSVARRTREIGIRMALGAERNSVMWLVLKEVTAMVVVGVAVGVPLALALSRIVQSQLFDLSAGDPIAIAGAAAILALVALVAGYLPARRATRVDPMLALRYE